MAYDIPGLDISLPAASDLSSSQFLAVKINSSGQIALAGAGDAAVGVLQDTPASGQVGSVRLSGVTRMVCGGTVTAGDLVAADASAKAKTAVKSSTNTADAGASADALIGSNVLGVALDSGTVGQVIPVALLHYGAVPTTNS